MGAKVIMIENVFFDLDGTLTDPVDGITNCLNYSLKKLGEPTRSKSDLLRFIGPPLRQNYANLLNTNDLDLIEKAVALYRERFSTVGLYENTLYDGIPELLGYLKTDSLKLFVVTSKPTIYSKEIITYFNLSQYFDGVFGSELDGRFDNKAELIKHVLVKHNLIPIETVMIGDRAVDITSGKSNGLNTIAAAYGYGSRKELLSCTPDYICDSPALILTIMRDYQSAINNS